MKLLVSTFAALVVFTATAQAAPLETKNVAANATWVVHVDVDAIRDSQIVQKAFATCPMLKESGKHFDMIRDKAGVDLRKDLHGITVYGPDAEKTHAVAIVFSTVNQKLLLEKAEHAADHKVTKHGAIDIHSWTHKHHEKTETAAGAFYKPDVLVFAATPQGVAAAIDVLDGKSAGIADGKSALGGKPPAGASFVARASAIPAKVNCAVLKQTQSLRIALGESKGKSFYHANLVMKTADDATQVKAMADGLKAVGELRFANEADVKKLVDALQTTVSGKTLKVRWEASADDVWNVVEKAAKKAAEHFKNKKGGDKSKPGKAKKAPAVPDTNEGT
jgi:hypothetical protein